MKIRIHRGAQEVGGNCIELNSAGKTLLLDLGMPLSAPDPDNVVLPDVPGLKGGGDRSFLGVVLSHPHADHYGLLSMAARSTRVFLGADALRILRAAVPFTSFGLDIPCALTYRDREPFEVGPFRVTPFLADHSAFDAYSFLVEADGRRLLYSGDFRGHGRKRGAFQRLLREPSIKGVDVLLMEGSNLGRAANSTAQPESDLEHDIVRSIQSASGLVLACFSAQNVDRFVTFWKAARRSGRTFVADVYLASVLEALSRPTLPKPKVFLPAAMKRKLKREGTAHLVRQFNRRRLYPENLAAQASKLVLLFRPSMAVELEGLQCLDGAKVIYSQWPGYIGRDRFNLSEWCRKNDLAFEILHTSGHADVPTLLLLAMAVAARRVIPIHSATPARLAELFPGATPVADGEWVVVV